MFIDVPSFWGFPVAFWTSEGTVWLFSAKAATTRTSFRMPPAVLKVRSWDESTRELVVRVRPFSPRGLEILWHILTGSYDELWFFSGCKSIWTSMFWYLFSRCSWDSAQMFASYAQEQLVVISFSFGSELLATNDHLSRSIYSIYILFRI